MSFQMPGDYAERIKDQSAEWGFETYSKHPRFWPMVANVIPMSRMSHNEYDKKVVGFVDKLPPERKIGGSITLAKAREGKVVIARKRRYELAYPMPHELLEIIQRGGNAERGLDAWIREMSMQFAEGRADREDTEFFAMFDNAAINAGHSSFNNTISDLIVDAGGDVIFDGESWVGASHNTLHGTTYSNTLGATNFSATGAKTARIRLEATNAKDELGNKKNIRGDLLLGAKDLEEDFEVYLNSLQKPGTANNDWSPGGSGRYAALGVPYITDTDAWFLMQRGAGVDAFQGGAPDIKQAFDIHHRTWIVSFQFEFAFRVTDWRTIVGANLSTS